ncbi:MAG TPA: tetratricopeptide repeat protein [Vicinamibacterales bacterium]
MTSTVLTPPAASPTAGRYRWLAAIACICSALLYLNALDNPYVYDDVRTVLDNPSIGDVGNVQAIVYREMTRPVVNFSYALDMALWGTPGVDRQEDLRLLAGFHLTNILLHAINVLLLFQLARLVVQDLAARGRNQVTARKATVIAFTTAAGFGMHPMMTESVGYISGRAEVLCGTFFLLALMAARRWMRGAGRAWLAVAFSVWVAALLSKEIAATWPLVLLGYDRLVLESDPARSRRRWRRVLGPLLGLTVALGLVRVAVLVFVENPGDAVVMWSHLLVEIEVAFRYFLLLVWPVGQTIFHQISPPGWPPAPLLLLAIVWLTAWVAVAIRIREREGGIALGMLWFLLLLAPSSALVLLNLGEPMAEHRVYLASAGFFLTAGFLVARLWALFDTRTPERRLGLRVALAGLLTVLGGLTVERNTVWSDPLALWTEATRRAPDVWVPHVMVGELLQNRGAHEDALASYRRAIALRPDEPIPYARLGLCLAELGRLGEAREAFENALRLDPDSPIGHNGLGAVAMLAGEHDTARRHYEEALLRVPDDVAARQSLALLYETVWHNPGEAVRLCEEVRRIAPATPGIDACIERNRARLPADSR